MTKAVRREHIQQLVGAVEEGECSGGCAPLGAREGAGDVQVLVSSVGATWLTTRATAEGLRNRRGGSCNRRRRGDRGRRRRHTGWGRDRGERWGRGVRCAALRLQPTALQLGDLEAILLLTKPAHKLALLRLLLQLHILALVVLLRSMALALRVGLLRLVLRLRGGRVRVRGGVRGGRGGAAHSLLALEAATDARLLLDLDLLLHLDVLEPLGRHLRVRDLDHLGGVGEVAERRSVQLLVELLRKVGVAAGVDQLR